MKTLTLTLFKLSIVVTGLCAVLAAAAWFISTHLTAVIVLGVLIVLLGALRIVWAKTAL